MRAEIFISPQLAGYFGPNTGGGGGYANYAQCVKYGIGREVIAKMLEGTEKEGAIQQALASLPLTARRKRGLELQAEEERRKAEEFLDAQGGIPATFAPAPPSRRAIAVRRPESIV